MVLLLIKIVLVLILVLAPKKRLRTFKNAPLFQSSQFFSVYSALILH